MTWTHSDSFLGIGQEMLLKLTEGVCGVNIAPSILMVTLVVSHRPMWVCVTRPRLLLWALKFLEIVAGAFMVTGSNGPPWDAKWDVQRTISVKRSLSLVQVQMKYFICVKDSCGLLDVTSRSRVTLYLLQTDDMTAGWPYHRQACASQRSPCADVSVVRVWMDLETRGLNNVDRRGPSCSRAVIAVPQQRRSHWRRANCAPVKSVTTILNYFNRLAYRTICLNN